MQYTISFVMRGEEKMEEERFSFEMLHFTVMASESISYISVKLEDLESLKTTGTTTSSGKIFDHFNIFGHLMYAQLIQILLRLSAISSGGASRGEGELFLRALMF